MRVTGGPDPLNNTHRALLWAKAEVSGLDVRLEYDYTRHDAQCAQPPFPCIGNGTQLFISTEGTGVSSTLCNPAIPLDPTTITHPGPPLNYVNGCLNGIRANYSIAYNQNPSLNQQIRINLLPGSNEVEPGSPQDHPFTAGIKHHVIWEKIGDTVTVEVTPEGSAPLTWQWTHPDLAQKAGARIGIYHQPHRDATYRNFKIWERKPVV